ncbi:LysR substrate binding domain-containing protein [Agromyces ramosus]|uniref:LysR substrate binding domain-containing protein n=1 Tax=Agromyces ramosus TaxID=33879 RepID=A0A4Q7MDA7_9MICO|nr:LysR family substrate-binding domain-containing protein [Agromyces ramosus]RZS64309.1 LysR substrate binding domain-containing protein [Agromyces ramosus]
MTLRLRYVAGVSPAKWLRVWADRRPDLPLESSRVEQDDQLVDLLAGDADVAFVRLPVEAEGLHAIELWEEAAVAVLSKDHPFADAEALTLDDLAADPLAPPQHDAAMTIELVAAGTGHAIVPQGVARLHHRRDVVAVPVTDAAPTRIALVWRVERDDADIQEFVGVVRGRTARSSRGELDEADETSPTTKGAAGAKAAKGSGSSAKGSKGGTGGKGGMGGASKSGGASKGRRGASARTGRAVRKRGGRGR